MNSTTTAVRGVGKTKKRIGADAVASKGWWQSYRWLLLRRFVQIAILAAFMLGPWFGLWLVEGNLNYSYTLDFLPLTDPFIAVQTLLTGQNLILTGWIGLAIVVMFYFLVGGRVFCSWVCPVNMLTDASAWLREKLGIKGSAHVARHTRYWILALVLILPLITGKVAWDLVNPVSIFHRGLFFGFGIGWLVLMAVFLFDLFVMARGWCGHLCPVGAFYGLIGRLSPVKVSAPARSACNDCMDCFAVCPEPQVIRPALKGEEKGLGPVILSPECTNCGRCIDVCSESVFVFSSRFSRKTVALKPVVPSTAPDT